MIKARTRLEPLIVWRSVSRLINLTDFFDRIALRIPELRLVFARFDTRQIGPRLPATAGATAAPARQARPDLPAIGVRRILCLPPCGVQQSGRAFPHWGTATPTLGPLLPCQCRQAVLRQTRKRPKAVWLGNVVAELAPGTGRLLLSVRLINRDTLWQTINGSRRVLAFITF